jgi:xanthine dehydrogenase small subunit
LSAFANILIEEFGDLDELFTRFGSLPIRNQATMGGNLANASPIADLPPMLIALNAVIHLVSESNTRTIDVENFYIGYRKTLLSPKEIIEKVSIPRRKQNHFLKIYKITKRWEDDISAVCGAFYLSLKDHRVEGIRAAFGGMAEIPKRAIHLEEELKNKPWTLPTIERAMDALQKDYTPIDDVRASKTYRMRVAQNLLKKLFWELSFGGSSSPAPITRINHFVPTSEFK